MSFFAILNNQFPLPEGADAPASMMTACSMPMHQLVRRSFKKPPSHLRRRYFDPQLYLAGLDARQSARVCAKLATYPWFGTTGTLTAYDSAVVNQAGWMEEAEKKISAIWHAAPAATSHVIAQAATAAVALQQRLGCEGFILPSPLTADLSTDYATEIEWLNAGVTAARSLAPTKPVWATVALSDGCLRFVEPAQNSLLELIADCVTTRGVDGVYLVIEQGGETSDTRMCGNARVLAGALRLIHLIKAEAGVPVRVGFLGAFGLACVAAGADAWFSGWYKSLHRVRLADKIEGGRAYPLFWSFPLAADVSLDTDFDALRREGLLEEIADVTPASRGLFLAARAGRQVSSVGAWQYSQSNVAAAGAHFYQSGQNASQMLAGVTAADRLDAVEGWLEGAANLAGRVGTVLGRDAKTNLRHVASWRDALRNYRATHRV